MAILSIVGVSLRLDRTRERVKTLWSSSNCLLGRKGTSKRAKKRLRGRGAGHVDTFHQLPCYRDRYFSKVYGPLALHTIPVSPIPSNFWPCYRRKSPLAPRWRQLVQPDRPWARVGAHMEVADPTVNLVPLPLWRGAPCLPGCLANSGP